jgi:hypothetical protein
MTEKGKKPGAEAAGQPDPLSATGMFLNAFAPQPEPSVEQVRESPAKGAAKPGQPGEFTQIFHKVEAPPPPPQSRSTNSPPQEPGEFTRMFVAAATSHDLRPAPAIADPAPFAPSATPPPPTPKLRGFSAPGISDSASPEGSFTQLFRTPPSTAAPPPVQPFTPVPITPPRAAESEWAQSLDPAPNGNRMEPGGLSQLFRSLSEESESPPNRIGESPNPSPGQPPAGYPASVTMLIQRLTEDLQQAVGSTPPMQQAAAPAGLAGPGEFTRIIGGGAISPASAAEPGAAAGSGVAAGNFAMPVPPTLVFPAAPVPAFAAPPVPAPPAPVFAPPQVPAPPAPAFAPQVPALAVPPAQPPKVAPNAPPQQSKLQQMLPMLLVLNAFLVVVLILLLVFALRSR